MEHAKSAVMSLAATVMLLAGCGQPDTPGTPQEATPSPTTSPAPRVDPPAGFPQQFPPPPQDAPLIRATLKENAMTDMEGEHHGTVIHRSYRFETGTGTEQDFDAVLQYYEEALPDAGWSIEDEKRADSTSKPDRAKVRLVISGHGYDRVELHQVSVYIQQLEDVVHTEVSVTDFFDDRAPYYTYPPLIPLPDQLTVLANQLPQDAIRDRVEIRHQLDGPNTAEISFYLPDKHGPDNNHMVLETVADHYRTALPALGWSITDDQQESDHEDLEHSTLDTETRVIGFETVDLTGRLYARQMTYSSVGNQNVSASLTLTLP